MACSGVCGDVGVVLCGGRVRAIMRISWTVAAGGMSARFPMDVICVCSAPGAKSFACACETKAGRCAAALPHCNGY